MSTHSEGLDLKWLEQVLVNESRKSKIIKILSVDDIDSAVPTGENYCSSIYRVKLRCAFESGFEKCISLIIKQVITSKEKNVIIELLPEIFKIEIEVYSVIFPLMEKLMAEFEDEREKLWCHFYGHLENQAIVFEDLSESGFKTLRRTDWLSFEHSSLALENLARFHAMSKILIDRGLIKKTDFTHNSMCTDIEFGHKLYAGPLEVLAEAMVESWGHEWKEVSDRIKLQVPLVSHKINELAVVQDDRYLVFNHGDLWTCNIMMKPEKSTTAESLRFLDFQVPCINTFIWDVIIFMFTSTHPQVRRRKQDDLLSVYQKSLEENLRSFNCQSYVPNLNDVISEFERVWYLSFVFNMTFFPLSSSSKCKPFEISKVLDHTPQEVFDKSAFTDERLVPELQEDLKIYIEKGVI
uniref:Elongation factor 4 n=2 Tax=Lygus hesperus TaxID=30085 RepID=A0A0A9W3U8_LYGHE